MGIAFVFPGQGSQKLGMGKDFVERYPDVGERYFAEADRILGMELTKLCFEGPEDALRSTDNTQPAIFTMSMAVLDVLRREGVEADMAAGHSLGEYGALVCAGVLEFPDALRLVRRRGELMAAVNARTPGAMAAIIGLAPETVEELCAKAAAQGGVVEPANYNEPEQTVISGEAEAVSRASELAKEAGARVVPLEVGAPFHCSLMDALGEEFAAELDRYDFADPRIPVIANVTGAPVTHRRRGQGRPAPPGRRRRALDRHPAPPGRRRRRHHRRGRPGPRARRPGDEDGPDIATHATGEVKRLEKSLQALTGPA